METTNKRGKTRYDEYSLEKMMAIKKRIERHRGERPKFFAILIDDEMVVEKTTEVEHFDDFLGFMEPTTTEIEVRLFFGSSPHHNKRIFKTALDGLAGVNKITDSEQDRKQWQLERDCIDQKKKIKKYKTQIIDLENENDELQAKIEELTAKVDTKTLIETGFNKLAGLASGFKAQTNTPLQGTNELTGEVEIEGISETNTPSQTALQFDQLMKEYNVKNPKSILIMNTKIIKDKALQKTIFQIIKNKGS